MNSGKRRTKMLSKAQQRFMDGMKVTGSLHSPHTSGIESVRALAAWYKTATSLRDMGLITISFNGSMSVARPAEARRS